MTYDERDGFDEAANQGNGILGQHLKCAKGQWLLDDTGIETGENGLKICLIMDSATVGEVRWEDAKIVERNIGRMVDGRAPPKPGAVPEGWNPYISFLAVRADDEHLGDLLTFTSSSWGGLFAVTNLSCLYRLKQKRQFPVCQLETKERRDENRNIDPVFKPVTWRDRKNFAELLALPAEQTAAITYAPKPATVPTVAELVSDEIPF